jgi:hypothetical protein
MRKLVLLVCMVAISGLAAASAGAQTGIIPTLESRSGKFGFCPISNEITFFKNVDDAGSDRGRTLQFVIINSFKLCTEFSLEFTADYNWDCAPGLDHDHYVELSLVKPVTKCLSLNVQRVVSTFEPESINQFGLRLRL